MAEEGLGERLLRILADKKMQQKELAYLADLPQSSLNRLITGETQDPQVSTLLRLARALRMTLDQIVGEDKDAESPLTPYDTNSDYRKLIDRLESLPQRERDRILNHVQWIIGLAEDGRK